MVADSVGPGGGGTTIAATPDVIVVQMGGNDLWTTTAEGETRPPIPWVAGVWRCSGGHAWLAWEFMFRWREKAARATTADGPDAARGDICEWWQADRVPADSFQSRAGILVRERGVTLLLEVDPGAPHRVALPALPGGIRHNEIAETDIERVVRRALDFLVASGLSPVLVVVSDAQPPSLEGWLNTRPDLAVLTEKTTEFEWKRTAYVAPNCDRTPFGADLFGRVARRLFVEADRGGLFEKHPGYCGHGLVFRGGRFELVQVEDGRPLTELGHWLAESDFVDHFASLDDWTCSGADLAAPLFRAESAWELANQRITRRRLGAYAGAPAPESTY